MNALVVLNLGSQPTGAGVGNNVVPDLQQDYTSIPSVEFPEYNSVTAVATTAQAFITRSESHEIDQGAGLSTIMDIIGHGMIARALTLYQHEHPDAVIFASGVANSQMTAASEYERELSLLYATLQQCAADGRRLVYFSSGGAIYGPTQSPRSEGTPPYPMTLYGRHKLFCEAVIRGSGARHLILRLANLVGPSQNRNQLIPALVEQIQKGEVIVYADATRDLMDVADFARILVSLLTLYPLSDTLVVATGVSHPIIDIITVLEDIIGKRAHKKMVAGGDPQQFDVRRLHGILQTQDEFLSDDLSKTLAGNFQKG